MQKDIVNHIDDLIDANPIQESLQLSDNESISLISSLRRLYEAGRVRYTEQGYMYRGVLVKLSGPAAEMKGLNG